MLANFAGLHMSHPKLNAANNHGGNMERLIEQAFYELTWGDTRCQPLEETKSVDWDKEFPDLANVRLPKTRAEARFDAEIEQIREELFGKKEDVDVFDPASWDFAQPA